ncbi:MAG: hypothetical protein KF878_12930 [Planctomycetes bacterium]|nr:hypothetical protein [Planctomycetota bacterium]
MGNGEHTVSVEGLTAEDRQAIDDLVEDSPFPEQVLLRMALRIGMMAIRKDPKIVLTFLQREGKK